MASDEHLDQSLAVLAASYGNTTRPAEVDATPHDDLSFDEALWVFGVATRAHVYKPMLQERLVALTAAGTPAPSGEMLRTELFWFLFSQKAWERILHYADSIGREAGQLPAHVADICFLAVYRLELPRILAGTDRDGFVGAARHRLQMVREAWPAAGARHRLFEAVIAHVSGDFDGARRQFTRIVAEEPFLGPFAAHENVLPVGFTGTAPPPLAEVHPAAARAAIVLSMDATYFDKFGRVFAEAFAQSNVGAGLHLHCVGFDPSAAIGGWTLPVTFGWSIDRRDLSALRQQQRRGYYASARYIYLDHYLETYDTVFVADIDGLMARHIDDIAADHADADIVLSTKVLDPGRALNRLPWEAVTANAFLARATPGGRQFARATGQYLETAFQKASTMDTAYWYADQNALFYAWRDAPAGTRITAFERPPFAQAGTWKLFQGDTHRLSLMTTHKARG